MAQAANSIGTLYCELSEVHLSGQGVTKTGKYLKMREKQQQEQCKIAVWRHSAITHSQEVQKKYEGRHATNSRYGARMSK